MNVLVYEHSAVGRDLLGRILRELGATVLPAGRAETFIPIDTENVTPELLERLDALVVAAEASGGPTPDVIVSTDGDSDRPFVAAVLPKGEAGSRIRFLPGDLLGLTVAELLGADAVAVPISSNDAVERRMTERAVHLEKTRIGSPYVVAALARLTVRGGYARVVGWEANGGFLLGSEVTLGASPLTPLPTRDSILPILAALVGGQDAKVPLSTLWERLPARFGASGLKDNVPVNVSRSIMQALVPSGEVTEVRFGKDSVVEPTAGGALYPKEVEVWRDAARTLARYFTKDLGFGEIERLNVLDGARAYFSNGDVAHIRPSGNAPQLRIYANADSRERAEAIVAMGLREPDGILSSLTRAFG
jgi:phosphomannomutase